MAQNSESRLQMSSLVDEELEFYTDLALNETQRWVEGVTRRKFQYPDDIRRSLEDGVLLLELLETLQHGSTEKANGYKNSSFQKALPLALHSNGRFHFESDCATDTAIDMYLYHFTAVRKDNVCAFLEACCEHFGLQGWQLFQASDLEDLSKQKRFHKSEIEVETDKRLRNVAVTIYWLGKSVEDFFTGPQLDYTAFTGLVSHHQKHIVFSSPKEQNHKNVNGFNDSSISDISFSESEVFESDHINSCDSYSGIIRNCDTVDNSRNIVDFKNGVNMPARYNDQRHHSADSFRNSGNFDHLCSDRAEDSDGSLPRGINPATSNDNIHHGRSGSTDSLDTPSIGSHSRQSSGSVDSMNAVTSTASGSTAPFRKTSSTVAPARPPTNPMQFVKHGRSTNMSAEEAAKQRQLDLEVRESKKKQQFDGEEWQENLTSWRSKRLTKSVSYHRSGGDADDDDDGKRGVKTYKEIVEDRKGRRSSLCFYPTDDDELEFDTTPIRNQRRASLSHHPGFMTNDGASLLGQQRKTRKTSLNFYPIEDDDFPGVSTSKSETKRLSNIEAEPEEEDRSSAYIPPKPGQHLTSIMQEPIGEEEIAPWATDEPDWATGLPTVKIKAPRRFHLENVPLAHRENVDIDKNGTDSVNGEKSPKLDAKSSKEQKNLKKSSPKATPKDSKKTANNDTKKTEQTPFGKGMLKPTPKKQPPGKIPGKDQLKPVSKDQKPAWASKDLKSSAKGQKTDSKDSKDTKLPVKDTKPDETIPNGKKKTDETPVKKPGRRTAPAAMPSRRTGMAAPPPTNPHLLLDQLDIPDKHKTDYQKKKPVSSSSSSDESSDSDSEEAKDTVSARTTTLFNTRNNLGGRRRKVSAPAPPVTSELNAPRERRSSTGDRPDPYFLHPSKHYESEEVEVTITQEPNTAGGFGISIKGGKDQLCPIIVDKIAPGSAASMCNICEGDEIVYVNNQNAEDQFRGSIMLVINQANKKGQLEMKLRRYENKKKTKVKISDPAYSRRSLSFEANHALPGVGTGEYSHGLRRKSAGPELQGRPNRLVDIPLTETEEHDEPITTPPAGIVAQRRSSLQSSMMTKKFEFEDMPPDLGDDDDLFEELIKPEEILIEESAPIQKEEKPPEPEVKKPMLSNRFTRMPSIVDAQEKLRREKESVDLDDGSLDSDGDDEKLEQEIMDRLEREAEEEEQESNEMERMHHSILSSEDEPRAKRQSPLIQAREPKRENICDEQNVPKHVTSSGMSVSDDQSSPGTAQKNSVTLNMNLQPSFPRITKQDSVDSPPPRKDSWRNSQEQESAPATEDTKPVKNVASFELHATVPDYSKPSFVQKSELEEIVKPSVESVSYSEPPKMIIEEPPKPAIPSSPKPTPPAPSPKPFKVSPRTASPRRPRSNKNYSFLEKFASMDEPDSKVEEYKPHSYAMPYLDKYVKELDQEKEFENLFDFENKDNDSGQKTYTVYDRYMDHSPRSDISLTTKPKPYSGYVEVTKPKPFFGISLEGSGPSSTSSSTADLSAKADALYASKPRPYAPPQEAFDSNSDKNEPKKSEDVNSMDYSRQVPQDNTGEKYDQDRQVPPLDMSFGSSKDEEKPWEKSEKPKLPWEKMEFRKFGSLDSLKKDSPRSNNSNNSTVTPPWRSESPARQEREREESTARWAEAASHTKPQFESPSKLLDQPEQQWNESASSDFSNGDLHKKGSKPYKSARLEEEKRKREDWRREQERKNQALFAKGQKLREGDSLEDIDTQDIERNDSVHQAIRNTELRKLHDLKNGSIPDWAQTDRPETDDYDHEMEEKSRQEAEEWERYRKEKERVRLEREEHEKQGKKDEEKQQIAHQRHLEDKQKEQQIEEEQRRKKVIERERQQKQEEAERSKREHELMEWQRKQELELEQLHKEREQDKRRWEEQQRQRPDTLPVQPRHQIHASVAPGNLSQPPHPEGRNYDPSYLDGNIMQPDRFYQQQSNGRSPRAAEARGPERGQQKGIINPKGEFLSASPLIGRRDVRSPKTHKKGPISAHPITKEDIRDGSIPQPKRRDASSPSVHTRNPLGHNHGQSPLSGSPPFLRRDDVMNINRKSLGRSGDFTPEDSPVVQVSPEQMTKDRLAVRAAPRAQKHNDWVQPQHKKTPGEPVEKDISRGYWLIEEAERRRQAEMNERELQRRGAAPQNPNGHHHQGQGYHPGQGHPRLMDERTGGSPFYEAPGSRSSQSMPRDFHNSKTMPDLRQPGDPVQKSHQANNADHYEPQLMTKSQSLPQFGQAPTQDNHDGSHPGYQSRHPQHHPQSRQEQPEPPSYAPSAQARAVVPPGPAPAKPPRGAPLPGGASTAEPVISVSGKHRCSHCMKELGQGAAMVIESLQLYYHTQCFRCCVCHTRLGTGQAGADVRVRGSRLHCQNCYSNDEGMKYSRV